MKTRDIWSKKILLLLPAFAMLVSACSSTSAPQDQPGTTSSAQSADDGNNSLEQSDLLAESSSEPAECPFPEIVGLESVCTKVTVPLRWGDPDSGTIDLVVADVRSPETPDEAVPVMYLQGGPGGDLLQQLPGAADLLESVAADRPFMVIANRTDDDSSAAMVLEEPGVDLTAFSSKQMVDDVEAVRLQLGIDSWKLWGQSYGTPLAMLTMEKYPEGIDSVVLESPILVDPAERASVYLLSLGQYERIFTACAESAECNDNYPNLEQRFIDLVDELNENPLPAEFTFTDLETGESGVLTPDVDGAYLMDLFIESPRDVGLFPKLIAELENGDTSSVGEIEPGTFDGFAEEGDDNTDGQEEGDGESDDEDGDDGPGSEWDASQLVVCNDLLGGVTESDFDVDDSIPLAPTAAVSNPDFLSYESFMDLCGDIGGDGSEAFPSEPIKSDVPVLLLKGTLDGDFADRDMAEEFAETLPNSTIIKPDWVGHDPAITSPCSFQILLDYLNDPASATKETCAEENTITWAPPT